jgi:hypothetical protein
VHLISCVSHNTARHTPPHDTTRHAQRTFSVAAQALPKDLPPRGRTQFRVLQRTRMSEVGQPPPPIAPSHSGGPHLS